MKILIIGDLHGRKPQMHFKDFDCIVQVGDVCDDREISPYARQWFRSLKKAKEDIMYEDFIIKKIGKKRLNQMEARSLKKGNEILKYLDSFGKPVFFVPGNWDQSEGKTKIKNPNKNDYTSYQSWFDSYLGRKLNPRLIRGLKNLKNCQLQLKKFNGVNFFGHGLHSGVLKPSLLRRKSNLTKKQYSLLVKKYDNLLGVLKTEYMKRNQKFPTIFISHSVPYGNKLDIGMQKGSIAYGKHLGSPSTLDFIKKYQPLLCVSGHIHEHSGKIKIGKTTVINAGFGKDAQVLINLNEKTKKVKSIKFFNKSSNH